MLPPRAGCGGRDRQGGLRRFSITAIPYPTTPPLAKLILESRNHEKVVSKVGTSSLTAKDREMTVRMASISKHGVWVALWTIVLATTLVRVPAQGKQDQAL